MGIKSEKKELIEFFYICTAIVLANGFINISILTNLNILKFEYIKSSMEVLDVFKLFCIFLVIGSIISIRRNSHNNIFQDIINYGRYLIFLNIGLLIYKLYMINTQTSTLLIKTSSNMFFFSMPMTAIWINSRVLNSILNSDRRIQWQKACGTYKETSNMNTYFWRFKLNFSNFENGFSRNDILKSSDYGSLINFIGAFILVGAFTRGVQTIYLIILLKPILFAIDCLFKLVTSIEGECTGIYEKTRGRGSSSNYYVYIITDYDKKIEIKFESDNKLFFNEGSNVKVYYTLLSKCILKHRPLNNIRTRF